jgi:hypothetical protein
MAAGVTGVLVFTVGFLFSFFLSQPSEEKPPQPEVKSVGPEEKPAVEENIKSASAD